MIVSPETLESVLPRCTILPCTPSILASLQDPGKFHILHSVFIGGEAPSSNLVAAWYSDKRKVFNCYGPSETTCCSLIAELLPGKPITLGRTMAKSEVILMDTTSTPCQQGEIWISGPGLAQGYFQNEAQTKDRFKIYRGQRFYCTGDYARVDANGIHFLGRQDAIIKNRGFLVNLETQIVPALRNQGAVNAATAVQHNGKLIGFVTPKSVDTEGLRRSLAKVHDSFLVPDIIVAMDELPLTSNGKINRYVLKDSISKPQAKSCLRLSIDNQSPNRTRASSPATLKLDLVLSVVSRCIGIERDRVHEHSTFWSLGGNSLLAIRVLSELRLHGWHLPMTKLLGPWSLFKVAEAMETQESSEGPPTLSRVGNAQELTATQLRLLYGSLKDPFLNNMIVSVELTTASSGITDVLMRQCWEALFIRHPILSTKLHLEHDKQCSPRYAEVDYRSILVPLDQWERIRDEQIHALIRLPLNHFPTDTRIRVLSSPGRRMDVLWLVHHSRIDGWSIRIVLNELQLMLSGHELPPTSQFQDAVKAEQAWSDKDVHESKSFWTTILQNQHKSNELQLPVPDELPCTARPFEANSVTKFALSRVVEISRTLQVSPTAIIYGAWSLLLMAYTDCDTASFGAVFSGRNLPMPGIEQVVGPLMETYPFPVSLDAQILREDWLTGIQDQLLRMSDLQWAAAAQPLRNGVYGAHSLYDTLVSVQLGLPPLTYTGNVSSHSWSIRHIQASEFVWTLLAEENQDSLSFRLIYNGQKSSSILAEQALAHFCNIFSELMNPSTKLAGEAQSSMLSYEEKTALVQLPQSFHEHYVGPHTLEAAFDACALKYPNMVAVEYLQDSMTYQQLSDISGEIALTVRARVSQARIVPIVSDGSLDWIIGVLSVVKAGLAYCCIDHSFPATQKEYMIKSCQAEVVLIPSSKSYDPLLSPHSYQIIIVETSRSGIPGQSSELSRTPQADSSDTKTMRVDEMALVVFTSGTTGTPKAVPLTNQALLSYIWFPPARLHTTPARRNGQMFSVGSDVCAAEIFGTLCFGGTLVLKDPQNQLVHLRSVNAVIVTPAFLSNSRPQDFPNLDTIVSGGDVMSQGAGETWSRGRRLYNIYGPCECSIGAFSKLLEPNVTVTLGRPIPRVSAYILDHQDLPVPIGIPGEIVLTGPQVAAGYLIADETSRTRFMPDPFHKGYTAFRTRDCGRWTSDMELEFLGRLDDQIKIRGHRVNLKELEDFIRRSSSKVIQAAVVHADEHITAFIAAKDVDKESLASKLHKSLPYYSQPARIIELPQLPVTSNQKVDYRALRDIAGERGSDRIQVRGSLESTVAGIWSELLKVSRKDIFATGHSAHFFQLGGDSLLQIRFTRELRRVLSSDIPLKLVVENPFLGDLVQSLQKIGVSAAESQALFQPFRYFQHSEIETQIVSHLEHELCSMAARYTVSAAFNMPCLVRIDGAVEIDSLSAAINHVLRSHRIFRSRFQVQDGSVARTLSVSSPTCRVQHEPDLEPFLEEEINHPFSVDEDHLIRVSLIQTQTSVLHLLVIAHHSIMDSTSLKILFESLQSLLKSRKRRFLVEDEPQQEDLDYIDWIRWSRDQRSSSINRGFWTEYFKDQAPPDPKLPQGENYDNTGRTYHCVINAVTSARLTALCKQQHVSMQQVFLTAAALTLRTIHGSRDLTLAVPFHGRSEPGTENLIGLLLDRVPVRIRLDDVEISSNSDRAQLLDAIKGSHEAALSNFSSYRDILEELCTSEPQQPQQLFSTMVSVHAIGNNVVGFDIPDCITEWRRLKPKGGAKFPLLLEVFEGAGGAAGEIKIEIEYFTALFGAGEIEKFAETLKVALRRLCEAV